MKIPHKITNMIHRVLSICFYNIDSYYTLGEILAFKTFAIFCMTKPTTIKKKFVIFLKTNNNLSKCVIEMSLLERWHSIID